MLQIASYRVQKILKLHLQKTQYMKQIVNGFTIDSETTILKLFY